MNPPPDGSDAASEPLGTRSVASDAGSKPSLNPRQERKLRRSRLRRERAHAFDSKFESAARWMLARGVHPNHFTFLQLPVFVFSILAAVEGWAWPFILMIVFVIILDGGDGILARVGNLQTKTGAVLDSTFDTLGIAIVLWGATRFHPEAEVWFLFLFLGNTALFLQNALLGHKVISYVRGPVLAAVAFPEVLLAGLLIASFILAWLMLTRIKPTMRALFTPIVLPG